MLVRPNTKLLAQDLTICFHTWTENRGRDVNLITLQYWCPLHDMSIPAGKGLFRTIADDVNNFYAESNK